MLSDDIDDIYVDVYPSVYRGASKLELIGRGFKLNGAGRRVLARSQVHGYRGRSKFNSTVINRAARAENGEKFRHGKSNGLHPKCRWNCRGAHSSRFFLEVCFYDVYIDCTTSSWFLCEMKWHVLREFEYTFQFPYLDIFLKFSKLLSFLLFYDYI